jgi:hypothetical protein
MTSRERVLAAIENRTPDRPPLNYFGTPETTGKLLAHLKLDTHEDLLCALGADMRYVAPRFVGPSFFSGPSGFSSGGTDMWGVEWQPVSNPSCDKPKGPFSEGFQTERSPSGGNLQGRICSSASRRLLLERLFASMDRMIEA